MTDRGRVAGARRAVATRSGGPVARRRRRPGRALVAVVHAAHRPAPRIRRGPVAVRPAQPPRPARPCSPRPPPSACSPRAPPSRPRSASATGSSRTSATPATTSASYDLSFTYPGDNDKPLDAVTTIDARTTARAGPRQPRLRARHGPLGRGQRRARRLHERRRGPGRHARDRGPGGQPRCRSPCGTPATRSARRPGRRLGAHRGRSRHGQPGRRRPPGLPLQRPPLRQGDVHLPGHRAQGATPPSPTVCPPAHRCRPGAPPPGRTAPSTPWPPSWPRSPSAAPPCCTAPDRTGCRSATSSRPRTAPRSNRWLTKTPGQIAWMEGKVGRYPFETYGLLIAEAPDRLRAGDPDALPLREGPVHRAGLPRVVRRVDHGARAGPPVVRRQRQPAHLVRPVAQRGPRHLVRGPVRRGEGGPAAWRSG